MDGAVSLSALVDSVLILAGHGYDFARTGGGQSGGDDGGGGISMGLIVAVLGLAAAVGGMLVWLNRRDAEPAVDGGAGILRMSSVLPVALLAAVIGAPLVLWTASSESDDRRLLVERWTSEKGQPELLVSLGDRQLNKLEMTNGRKTVRITCRGRDGQQVLAARQKWPFILERGYDYPQAHQPATAEQVRQAERCQLRGTSEKLSATVKGALKD